VSRRAAPRDPGAQPNKESARGGQRRRDDRFSSAGREFGARLGEDPRAGDQARREEDAAIRRGLCLLLPAATDGPPEISPNLIVRRRYSKHRLADEQREELREANQGTANNWHDDGTRAGRGVRQACVYNAGVESLELDERGGPADAYELVDGEFWVFGLRGTGVVRDEPLQGTRPGDAGEGGPGQGVDAGSGTEKRPRREGLRGLGRT